MHTALISPEELNTKLREVRIVDARPGSELYLKGHLEGAVHADLNRDLSGALVPGHDPSKGGRHPLPSCKLFARTLDSWGVTPHTNVVVYDDQGGANAAARLWWMLRSFGHDRVRVLDGGLKGALAAGMNFTTEMPDMTTTTSAWPAAWTAPTVSIDEVEARSGKPGWKVLDVRSGERFRGESEQLDPVAGHIPGAENVFFGENLAASGRFKSGEELRAIYTKFLGTLPADHLIVQCGSGVTACHTLLALELAGLSGSPLYVGSWSEWCRSGKPQAKGG